MEVKHLFFVHNWRTFLIAELIIANSLSLSNTPSEVFYVAARGFATILNKIGINSIFDLDPVFEVPYSYLNSCSPHKERDLLRVYSMISDFLGSSGFILYIPHLADAWMRFIASHENIKGIHFIEEGNKYSASQQDSACSTSSKGLLLAPTLFDKGLTTMFCQQIHNPELLKGSIFFCTQDNAHVRVKKIIYSDSEIILCLNDLLRNNRYLRSKNLIGQRLKRRKIPVLVGAKTYLDQTIFSKMLKEALSCSNERASLLAYKPHPSCRHHYSRSSRDFLMAQGIILCNSNLPIDLLIYTGSSPSLIGDTSSFLVSARRLDVEVDFIGMLDQTPNIRCSELEAIYSKARG